MRYRRFKIHHLLAIAWVWTCGFLCVACGELFTGEDLAPEEVLPNPEDPSDPTWGEDKDDLAPVMVTYSDPTYTVLTRGLGAFISTDETNPDAENPTLGKRNWENALLHFFAFHTGEDADYSIQLKDDKEKVNTLVDGSVDFPFERLSLGYDPTPHGKRAHLSAEEGGAFINWEETAEGLYYGTLDQTKPFKFYSYHIGQKDPDKAALATNFSRTNDDISFDINIDGTQDVLYSQSDVNLQEVIEKVNNSYPIDEDNMFPDEIAEAQQKREELHASLFSTFSAHRNVHPLMKYEHKLAYMNFKIFPGGNYRDMIENRDSIYVQAVRVRSRHKGHFTIVNKDLNKNGELTWSQDIDGGTNPEMPNYYNMVLTDTLRNESGNQMELMKDSFIVELKDEYFNADGTQKVPIYERDSVRLGESGILFAPCETLPLMMTLRRCFRDGTEQTYNVKYDIKLSDGKRFEAGYYYNVRIAIFGLYEIEVEAEVGPWQSGGNVDIEPDDWWGNGGG